MAAGPILVLAPHPDDEIVACGIAAMRARAAGARVFVLHLTTGVPAPAALWRWQRRQHAAWLQRRRAEAQAAAAVLGLEIVGFRDTPSRLLRHELDEAAADVAAAAARCGAASLWVPAFEGGHQDHDAANAVAATSAIAAAPRQLLPVWEFAAYNFAGGKVRSNHFPAARGDEIVIAATRDEAQSKRRALACYRSERGNLRHVGTDRETARPLPGHDYGAPPHPGRLFRERFHWVPFRHPRVDFAPSSEVYRSLGIWTASGPRPAPFEDGPSSEARQADREFAGALDEAEGERRLGA
ncbi:MAG: PIG-L family deacetylase [Thiohalocapsa sp.]